MQTWFIEAIGWVGAAGDRRPFNHGKFLLGQFSIEEWLRSSEVDHTLFLVGRGWDPRHLLVLDLETGEGAVFRPGGLASADLEKHAVRVCPLFPPFLDWLYHQDLADLDALPKVVNLIEGEHGYQSALWRDRQDPSLVHTSGMEELHDEVEGILDEALARGVPPETVVAERQQVS